MSPLNDVMVNDSIGILIRKERLGAQSKCVALLKQKEKRTA